MITRSKDAHWARVQQIQQEKMESGMDEVVDEFPVCEHTWGHSDHPCTKARGHFGPCGGKHGSNPWPRKDGFRCVDLKEFLGATGIAYAPAREADTELDMAEMDRRVAEKGDEFIQTGIRIGKIVKEKNAKYGDSFAQAGAIMRILYPNGISLEQYDDALGVIRVIDKLFRIATDRDALGESPWDDINGYSNLRSTQLNPVI